jgi:hypothetical protein
MKLEDVLNVNPTADLIRPYYSQSRYLRLRKRLGLEVFKKIEANFIVSNAEFWVEAFRGYEVSCNASGMTPLLFTEFCGTSFLFLVGNILLIHEEIESMTREVMC